MSREAVNSTPKRRSRAEVSRLVEQYLRSGLSLKAFRQQYQLDRKTLTRRLRQRLNSTAHNPPSPGWVRAELAPESDPLPVAVPTRRVGHHPERGFLRGPVWPGRTRRVIPPQMRFRAV